MVKFIVFLLGCTLIFFGVTYDKWSPLKSDVTIVVKEKVSLPSGDSKEYYIVHEGGKYKATKEEFNRAEVGCDFTYVEHNGWAIVCVAVGVVLIGIVLMSIGDGSSGLEFLAIVFELID